MNLKPFTACCATWFCVASSLRAADPLLWRNDTAPKQASIAFVEKVNKEGGSGFIPMPSSKS